MKERPILFSAPMVRAILAGQKTQTRRAINPQPHYDKHFTEDGMVLHRELRNTTTSIHSPLIAAHCRYGQPGDRLWVKETWQYYDWNEEGEPCIRYAADNATAWPNPSPEDWAEKLVDVWESLSRDENFKIDCRARDRKWRPSIFMPRWASRIQLEVVSVRVERLNEISEADAIAEGVQRTGGGRYWLGDDGMTPRGAARDAYRDLWESINGAGSWDTNPWVWVVEFKRIQPPKGRDCTKGEQQ